MKLDSESIYGHSTLARGPDSKFFEYNENVVETGRLKADNEIVREDNNGIVSDLKIKNCETDTDPLSTEEQNGDGVRNVPGLHDLVDMEDSVNSRENNTGDSVTLYNIPANDIKLSEKETDSFTDKSVMECELPELVVCFKDDTYHVVKDICIDEGLPSLDKILVENGEGHHEGLFGFLHSDFDVNSDLTKEMVDTAASISDGMKPFVECDCKTDVANQCGSENLIGEVEGNSDARDDIVNVVSDEVMPENILLVQELDTENSHSEPSNFDTDECQQQSDRDTSKEANWKNSIVASGAKESNNCNQANKVFFNSKVESGSITFDFDSSPPTTSGKEEDPQNADCQQVQTPNMLGFEEGTLDSRTASNRSFFIQHGHGESSFSSAGPFSGPIGYSGPIPYSGSISLRSDSSTTSTRSFAFPIIHSEWNSSPVKMAKADRRHFRKHRGWRMSLLCCRF